MLCVQICTIIYEFWQAPVTLPSIVPCRLQCPWTHCWSACGCCLHFFSSHTLTSGDYPGIFSIRSTASFLQPLGVPAGNLTMPPLKSGWKPCITCILHAYKISLTQRTQKFANGFSSSQALLVHGYCSLQVYKGLRLVNESQRNNFLLSGTYCASSDIHSSWWEAHCCWVSCYR